MPLSYEAYVTQQQRWPQSGRHILAQYDETSIIVYQAYRPSIGHFAANHGYFGGEFAFSRMSWLKTNFLWMMYRSGWGSKPGQEVTLAVRLKRSAFDTILAQAVHANYTPEVYSDKTAWQERLKQSSVRLQWDPDHDPTGLPLERRAIQLGLRDEILAHYAREWIIEIEDISAFVRQQSASAQTRNYACLVTPSETTYPITNQEVGKQIGIAR